MNLQIVLNTRKNLFLNQVISKKMLAKFFFQKKKNPKWKISNPPKNFDHLHHLKSVVPPWDWSVLSADQHIVNKKCLVFNQHSLRKGNVIEKGDFR